MSDLRSNRRDVRNPILGLDSVRGLQAMPPELRAALANLLLDLAKDAASRSATCWAKHKGPMAVYWKAVAVYAKHIARAVRA